MQQLPHRPGKRAHPSPVRNALPGVPPGLGMRGTTQGASRGDPFGSTGTGAYDTVEEGMR